jgi:hypothetical protein
MQRAGSESPSDYRKRKYMDYNHDCEMIFALPSLQLQLRTTHQQSEQEPVDNGMSENRICEFLLFFFVVCLLKIMYIVRSDGNMSD